MTTSRQERVLSTYSSQAETYDARGNVESCWGLDTERIIRSLELRESYRTVVDVGCGTGGALVDLASRTEYPGVRFVGVEPAENMRKRAIELARPFPNVEVLEGRFEDIPLDSQSVDYMFSINAFHWNHDMDRTISEIVRVMNPDGEMDHHFIGRDIGREFIQKTTPIFMKYMGPKRLLETATLRHNLTLEEAREIFQRAFGEDRTTLEERYDTYFDTVEGHMGWWVRIEPQLLAIPDDQRERCEEEVRRALGELETDRGVPYTKHTLHARVRAP